MSKVLSIFQQGLVIEELKDTVPDEKNRLDMVKEGICAELSMLWAIQCSTGQKLPVFTPLEEDPSEESNQRIILLVIEAVCMATDDEGYLVSQQKEQRLSFLSAIGSGLINGSRLKIEARLNSISKRQDFFGIMQEKYQKRYQNGSKTAEWRASKMKRWRAIDAANAQKWRNLKSRMPEHFIPITTHTLIEQMPFLISKMRERGFKVEDVTLVHEKLFEDVIKREALELQQGGSAMSIILAVSLWGSGSKRVGHMMGAFVYQTGGEKEGVNAVIFDPNYGEVQHELGAANGTNTQLYLQCSDLRKEYGDNRGKWQYWRVIEDE